MTCWPFCRAYSDDPELDDAGLAPCAYDDLDTVRFTRAFLEAPDRFVHAALDDLD